MLTIYRASAGAGKTHRLTGEYLTLLFTGARAYRHILAVTFTNKATDEMKGRIIEELHRLSSGRSSSYVDALQTTYGLTENQVRRQAAGILIDILHDYSAFNVSTIDRFFQQTMRAFTREIGLQGGYTIEMDQELVLTTAVDSLLANLEKPESKELLGWLLRFAEEKVESGGEWNLRKDIIALSREIFKESFKVSGEVVAEDIRDKEALENYKNELFAIIRSTETEAIRLGKLGQMLLEKYALTPADFYRGNITVSFFDKLAQGEMKPPNATFCSMADNVEACFKKTTSPETRRIISSAFEEGLNACVKQIIAFFNQLTTYQTAREIVRYYYTLGILTDMMRQIASYREEKNIMLIADTTELLDKVVGGSDAPFIYEKTGTHVRHYMIDEFQDTSGMQWNNFRPLLKESLAHGHTNLIVGDVKQSIYRFRNSDWKLLDEQVGRDFLPEEVQEETLLENWRSCRHIVAFNNAFFTAVPKILQTVYNENLLTSSLSEAQRAPYHTKIITAYANSRQQIPPPFQQKEGHVRVEFLSGDDDSDWKEEALNRLPGIVEQLQDNGYALKDIAILVRTNMEGAMVAERLLTYKEAHPSGHYQYDIISDEALFIGHSPAVRLLIALLRYLQHPDNRLNEQTAVYAYRILRGAATGKNELDVSSVTAFGTAFPPEIAAELDRLSGRSLYELSEGLFRLFSDSFHASEQVFVQAFLDLVAEYSRQERADLGRFLQWWEERGYRKTIATPDAQNAIRILTIHKSKGLGFKAVILPFGDWEVEHKPSKPVVLWCKPEVKPFNRLHLVPVRYSQSLGNTIFAEDYFRERLHAFIDNLNTLYVAFTRAKEELIIFAPRPKKINEETGEIEKISSMADALWAGLSQETHDACEEEDVLSLPASFDPREGLFELGSWWHPTAARQEDSHPQEMAMTHIHSVSPDDRLQLRLHGKGFFFDNDHRKHGALMHEILSRIRTCSDILPAVTMFRQTGVIDREEAKTLVCRLEQLLDIPEVQSWYDGTARVLNEVDILFDKGASRRPDRVMITCDSVVVVDYKFGDIRDSKHLSQVRNYMRLIRRMGYKEVEGYLWYVELQEVEPVTDR